MQLRDRWPWYVLGLALVLVCASALNPDGFRKARRLGADLQKLGAENAQLGAENDRLRRQIEQLESSPAHIERVARDELGLVRPGEIVFRVEDDP